MTWLPRRLARGQNETEDAYLLRLRDLFEADLEQLTLFGQEVHRRLTPKERGIPQSLWHLVSQDNGWGRSLAEPRAECVPWIKPMIEAAGTAQVKCWRNVRPAAKNGGRSVLIALPTFEYVVVLAERGGANGPPYYMLRTAYPTEKLRQQQLRGEYQRLGEYVHP